MLGTVGDFEGFVTPIYFFSNKSINNRRPVANAGANQIVFSGVEVTLDGSSSSDADNHNLTYSWTQTSGEQVTFNSNVVSPTFTAPSLSAGSEPLTLTFELTVSDSIEDSVLDEVTVIVRPPFDLILSEIYLLSSLALTETINSSNVVHLQNDGYDQSSIIFAGGFNTTSTSSQVIYESGGTGTGTTLRIGEVANQLSFVVSTGSDNDIDISSAINVNTDYVYIVEITGASDNSAINLYIAEGNSFSALDSVDPILGTITSTSNSFRWG